MPSGIPEDIAATRRHLRSAKGVAVRLGRDDEAARLDAEIRTAALAEHIARTVNAAPPLNTEQRDRLALLLRGGASDGSAA